MTAIKELYEGFKNYKIKSFATSLDEYRLIGRYLEKANSQGYTIKAIPNPKENQNNNLPKIEDNTIIMTLLNKAIDHLEQQRRLILENAIKTVCQNAGFKDAQSVMDNPLYELIIAQKGEVYTIKLCEVKERKVVKIELPYVD